MTLLSAREEWRSLWPLPITSMLGMSGAVIFAYSSSVLMQEVTTTFGWTRAQFSSTFFLQMILGLFSLPIVGWLVDQFGSRRVILFGFAPFVLSLASLGLANGSIKQWWLLCLVLAACQALVGPTVWVPAVVGRFHAARGLAMAVTLSGLGVGNMVWPILAALYLHKLGWRATFIAMALTWAVIVIPLTLIFLRDPIDRQHKAAPSSASASHSYGNALRSRTFVMLLLAGGLFSSAYFGLIVHLIPLLRTNGIELKTAAWIGGLAGLFGIIGRMATGYLLDRLPTRPIGVAVFLSPILASVLLLNAHASLTLSMAAVAVLGLAVGAEYDIVTFIAARRFGREIFASIYSIFTAIIGVCTGLGPVLAGALYDRTGSYRLFLLIIIPMVLAGAVLIAWVPLAAPDMQDT